jgi:hypothetical protein
MSLVAPVAVILAYLPTQPLRCSPPRMMCSGMDFWDHRQSRAQLQFDRLEMELEELQERENLYMERLSAATARVAELEALGDGSSGAALITTQASAANVPDTSLQVEVEELRVQQASLHEALRDAVTQRETDVQKVGAFWLGKLEEARAEAKSYRELAQRLTSDDAAPAPAATAPPPAPEPLPVPPGAGERIAALEEEIDRLEEDYDTLSERLEVQSETIMLANTRLDEVSAAFEAQALLTEQQLQSTSAFWLEKLRSAKAEAAEAAALREALAEATTKRELDVQRTAAFWLAKLEEAKSSLAAAIEGELYLLEALESKSQESEEQLQKVGLFWIEKLRAAKEEVDNKLADKKPAAKKPAAKKPAAKD